MSSNKSISVSDFLSEELISIPWSASDIVSDDRPTCWAVTTSENSQLVAMLVTVTFETKDEQSTGFVNIIGSNGISWRIPCNRKNKQDIINTLYRKARCSEIKGMLT